MTAAFAATRGNQIRAANLLGVNRNTLRKKDQGAEYPGDPHGNLIPRDLLPRIPMTTFKIERPDRYPDLATFRDTIEFRLIWRAPSCEGLSWSQPYKRASVSISRRSATLLTGSIAGLIGGLVEFGWVTLYTDITGQDSHQFAPGIVSAAAVRGLLPGRPPSLPSVIVNLLFAIILGIVLTLAWQAIKAEKPRLSNPLPFTLAALGVVWAMNFLVLLPIIRPEFVHLVPYGVSLTSSLLYGATVAAVLYDGVLRDAAP